MTAPPLIDSTDTAEAERLRELLSKRFDMADIKAAAEAVSESTAPMPEAEPQAQPGEAEPEPAQAQAPAAEEAAAAPSEEEPQAQPEEAEPEPAQAQAPAAEEAAAVPPAALSDLGSASVPPKLILPADPVQRAAIFGLAVVALLLLLVVWASISNSLRYFIVPTKGAVEIWRGDFSPTGKRVVAVLHGVQLNLSPKKTYGRNDIYPKIFAYYLNKADSLLDVKGLPDYKSINGYLQRADKFVLNEKMSHDVDTRQNHLQSLSLLYKADVEAGKGTPEAFQSALRSLMQAKQLTDDPAQLQLINKRIAQIQASFGAAKKGTKAPPAGPVKPK